MSVEFETTGKCLAIHVRNDEKQPDQVRADLCSDMDYSFLRVGSIDARHDRVGLATHGQDFWRGGHPAPAGVLLGFCRLADS